jgi:hypothetical protein
MTHVSPCDDAARSEHASGLDSLFPRDPTPQFLEFAQALAARLMIDIAMVARGDPLTMGPVNFWVNHHGMLDPDGAMLVIEIGELAAEGLPAQLRQFMEHNAVWPVRATGHLGLLPGSNVAVRLIPIDVTHAGALDHVIGHLNGEARSRALSQKMGGLMHELDREAQEE